MQTTTEATMADIDQVLHKALKNKSCRRRGKATTKKENGHKMTQILLLTAHFFK